MKRPGAALLFRLVKIAVTVSLIVALFTKVDFSMLARRLDGTGGLFLALGSLLLAANIPFVALRWWLLLRRLDVHVLSLGYAVAGTFASVFVGQATPGALGTDAVRGWLCYERAVRLRTIVMSLVTDRLLAILGLTIVAGIAWLCRFGLSDAGANRWIALAGPAAVAAALIAIWLLPNATARLAKRWRPVRTVHELLAIFRFTALSRAGVLGVILSCVVVALTVNAVTLFGRGFGVGIAPAVAYLMVPAAVLLSSLPISIGGWGVREASLSYGLTLFGTPADDAALVGIAFGIGLLLASLPGGIVILAAGPRLRLPSRGARAGVAGMNAEPTP